MNGLRIQEGSRWGIARRQQPGVIPLFNNQIGKVTEAVPPVLLSSKMYISGSSLPISFQSAISMINVAGSSKEVSFWLRRIERMDSLLQWRSWKVSQTKNKKKKELEHILPTSLEVTFLLTVTNHSEGKGKSLAPLFTPGNIRVGKSTSVFNMTMTITVRIGGYTSHVGIGGDSLKNH